MYLSTGISFSNNLFKKILPFLFQSVSERNGMSSNLNVSTDYTTKKEVNSMSFFLSPSVEMCEISQHNI